MDLDWMGLGRNAGGGGERVLWAAIAYLQREEPNVVCVVYTGDTDVTKSEIIDKVKVSLAPPPPSPIYRIFIFIYLWAGDSSASE